MTEVDVRKPPLSRDPAHQYTTYEDFLDSQLTERDLFYLEDEDLARQLIELGIRGTGVNFSREEFEAQRSEQRERSKPKPTSDNTLASEGLDFSTSPFLAALAAREEPNRNGKMMSILFIRDRNGKGQEISGYIDYASRLRTEAFEQYFEGKKKLLPGSSDLSYYNWETQTTFSRSSSNFQVIADSETGLLFKNKRNRKVINVDPKANPGDNSLRSDIKTTEYLQAVIFDHMTRRKS